MLGNDNKTSLSSEEYMDVVHVIKTSTKITELLQGIQDLIAPKYSLYLHYPAVGAIDYNKTKGIHSYNIPKHLLDPIQDAKQKKVDPVVGAAFIKGDFFWLSESVHEPYVIESGYTKMIEQSVKLIGDGLCFPLYGPNNRKGYAGMGFGRGKEEFDPIMPYQLYSLIQMAHIRYGMLIKALQKQIKLTPREAEVLELMGYGKTNPEIAIILGISPHTIAVYARKIYLKLDTADRVTAVMRAQTMSIKV